MLLGRSNWFNEDWARAQKAKDEHADANPRSFVGKEFTKTLALACPWCSNVFFVWQACGSETAPYDDPTPIRTQGKGQRYTCGHPICWDKEQVYQMKQTEDYRMACEKYWNNKTSKPEPTLKPKAKLVRLGGKDESAR